jgi:transmembrane sensor
MKLNIPWGLFTRFFNGELSSTETQELEFWRTTSELTRNIYEEIIEDEKIKEVLLSGKWEDNSAEWKKLLSVIRPLHRVNSNKSSNRFRFLKYAAIAALLITVAGLIWYSVENNKFPIEVTNQLGQKGKIILSDGSIYEFDTEQSTIRQTSSGSLTINSDTINLPVRKKASAMNQIIIPYGKRTEITLADGTHIWLNSGSRISYPAEFKFRAREVFLQGEAYFDVKPNPDQPFYVITRTVKIKVLGTSFNISSYIEDKDIQTVLVKGKISAKENKLFGHSIHLVPGERLTYDKSSGNLSKDKVEVSLYASWINGYLLFKNEPITSVLKKIERFYNKKIQLEDGLEKMTFSGKLDLKDNFQNVLRNISYVSSVLIIESKGSYIIKRSAYE